MAACHVQNGRLGGLAGGQVTLQRYGLLHFSDIGKLGGRPTMEETLRKDKQLREKAINRARRRNGVEPV